MLVVPSSAVVPGSGALDTALMSTSDLMPKGRKSVVKEKRLERELAQLLRDAALGADSPRPAISRRDEGAGRELPGFWLEAKVGTSPNPGAPLRQAVAAAKSGHWPLAACKNDRQTPVCVTNLPDVLQ